MEVHHFNLEPANEWEREHPCDAVLEEVIRRDLFQRVDCIICWELIEHVRWPDRWWTQVALLAKPGPDTRLLSRYCTPDRVPYWSNKEWRYPTLAGLAPGISAARWAFTEASFRDFVLKRV
jgi:2-polyprenyl-3-methyl-5-hydroxy-6-metoxy-1,4-benzoquinol methylase